MKKLSSAGKAGLHGRILVPGDKSISHRSIILGSISQGDTVINHFLEGEDCLRTLQAFRDLGVKIEKVDNQVIVHGKGVKALHQANSALEMGNSGTTTRLMMGLLAGLPFDSKLVGDSSLSQRPMNRVSEPLKVFGAKVDTTNGKLPATIKGGALHAAHYQLKIASAQVKSALILASLFADKSSTIIEALPTRNHTEIMLNQFGADVKTKADKVTITVQPHPQLIGQRVEVPGDISSAAFFMVAATIVPHSEIELQKVNLNPTRTGILTVLKKMNADVTITKLPSSGEPLGNIRVKTSNLKPIKLTATDIPALVDEIPLVALLAACATGTSEIRGAEELRVKETDRLLAITKELRKLGVVVEEKSDGLIITGQPEWKINNHILDSYGDHRIGMMDAIAALRTDEPLYLQNAASIRISYPNFFTDLAKINQGV